MAPAMVSASALSKRCPRCAARMSLEQDHYGRYYDCYQCGNHEEVTSPLPLVPDEGTHRPSKYAFIREA